MPEAPREGLFSFPRLVCFLALRACSQSGAHMFNVVLGWQVYALTGSALMLGVAGLVRFAPILFLFPVALAYDKGFIIRDFVEILIFVGILSLALVYAWKKGVFKWERKTYSPR